MSLELLIIVLSLLFSAFFSGMEIAYISSNKIHIELEKRQDDFLAKVFTKLTSRPSKFITTMLIGNNIALVIYGFFMGDLLMKWFQSFIPTQYQFLDYLLTDFSLFSQTVISTLIILLTAEFLPKVFFQIYSNKLLKFFAIPAYVFYIIFSLVSEFVLWVSDLILKKFFKTDGDEVQLAFTKVELGNYISEQMETVDDILGYVHSFELFKKPKSIKSIMRPVEFVPETMLIQDVLDVLTKKHKSIAVVLDEYGGTSGMMTIEDIIEELFGEIEDEHDSIELLEEQLNETEYKLSARHEVDYLNETYKLELPENENYETLGGLIVNSTEEIPRKDDSIQIENYLFTIVEVSNTKIDIVILKVLEDD